MSKFRKLSKNCTVNSSFFSILCVLVYGIWWLCVLLLLDYIFCFLNDDYDRRWDYPYCVCVLDGDIVVWCFLFCFHIMFVWCGFVFSDRTVWHHYLRWVFFLRYLLNKSLVLPYSACVCHLELVLSLCSLLRNVYWLVFVCMIVRSMLSSAMCYMYIWSLPNYGVCNIKTKVFAFTCTWVGDIRLLVVELLVDCVDEVVLYFFSVNQ